MNARGVGMLPASGSLIATGPSGFV